MCYNNIMDKEAPSAQLAEAAILALPTEGIGLIAVGFLFFLSQLNGA